MLVELLTHHGQRDLLTPSFTFRRLLSKDEETETFRDIARLRYEVYCEECGYLDPSAYQAQLETDGYDDRSVHVSAQTIEGEIVGTVRLVLARCDQIFPFEEHCPIYPDFLFPPREQCAEVSRLIVKKNYRRRAGDSLQGVSREFQEKGGAAEVTPQIPSIIHHKNRRSRSPQIMLGMYREMYRYSRQHGIRYWFAAMEKGLARLLDRMGFRFAPVGPETDYYGPVTPYMADLRQVENALNNANRFLLAWFQDEPISDWLLITTLVKYKLGHFGKI